MVMDDEASYICDACGEEIVIPFDISQGSSQEYVEDCPVCCQPAELTTQVDLYGNLLSVSAIRGND